MALQNYSRTLFVDNSDSLYTNLSQAKTLADFAIGNGYDGIALMDADNYFNNIDNFQSINNFISLLVNSGIKRVAAVTDGSVSPYNFSNYINKYSNLHDVILYNDFWDSGLSYADWKTAFEENVNALYTYASTVTKPVTTTTQPMFWLKDFKNTTVRDADAAEEIANIIVNNEGLSTTKELNVLIDLLDVVGIPSVEDANTISNDNAIGKLDSLAEAAERTGVTVNLYFYINADTDYAGSEIGSDYDTFEQTTLNKISDRLSKYQASFLNIKGFSYSNYTSATAVYRTIYASTTRKPTPPLCAVTGSPANNSSNVSLTPTFVWDQTLQPSYPGYTKVYDLQISYDNVTFTTLGSNLTSATYTVSGASPLLPGTIYYYRIIPKWKETSTGTLHPNTTCTTSVKFVTTGTANNPACATLISPGSVAGTTNASATSQLTFTWTPPSVGGANGYYNKQKFRYSTNGGSTYTSIDNLSPTLTNYSLGPFGYGVDIKWNVIPYSGSVSASNCTEFSLSTQPGIPSCPTIDPQTPVNGATNVILTPTIYWNASNGATSYTFDYGTSPTLVNATNVQGIAATSYQIPSNPQLANNTTYYYRVKAVNISGESSGCTIYSFTTAPAIPACPSYLSPTPANGAVNQSTSSFISWSAIVSTTGPADTYEVFVGNSAQTLNRVDTQGLNANPLTYRWPAAGTHLQPNTTYYYKVVASNSSGSSVNCTVQSFTTEQFVPPPAVGYIPNPSRVLKVNGFGSNILNGSSGGSTNAENLLLDYCLSCSINWLQLYDLKGILDGGSTSSKNNLAAFISRSRQAPYNIQKVGFISPNRYYWQKQIDYNLSRANIYQHLDDFNYENEFWIYGTGYGTTVGFVTANTAVTYSVQINGRVWSASGSSDPGLNIYNQIKNCGSFNFGPMPNGTEGIYYTSSLGSPITCSWSSTSKQLRIRSFTDADSEIRNKYIFATPAPVPDNKNIFGVGQELYISASSYNPERFLAPWYVEARVNNVVVSGDRSPNRNVDDATYSETNMYVRDEPSAMLQWLADLNWLRTTIDTYNTANPTYRWINSSYTVAYSEPVFADRRFDAKEADHMAAYLDVYEATAYYWNQKVPAERYAWQANLMGGAARRVGKTKQYIIPIFSAENIGVPPDGSNFWGGSAANPNPRGTAAQIVNNAWLAYQPNYPQGLRSLELDNLYRAQVSNPGTSYPLIHPTSESYLAHISGGNWFKYTEMYSYYPV